MTPSPTPTRPPFWRRVLRKMLAIPLAVWLFIEDWLWERLKAAMAAIARLPAVRRVETRIASLPAGLALLAFLLPTLLLFPAKLTALWLLAKGRVVLGAATLIVAKLIGTALVARIFSLTKPQLLTIPWFARVYTTFCGWRDRLFDYVRSLPSWRLAKAFLRSLRLAVRRWWLSLTNGGAL